MPANIDKIVCGLLAHKCPKAGFGTSFGSAVDVL